MQTYPAFFKNSTLAMIAGCLLILSSCKRDFDSPPDFTNPDITATTTISALKATHVEGKVEALPDAIIEGIVVADDKSGNFYKQLSIQDASGGITVRLDGTNLYANYPVGRKIYIKTKGLYMGDYAGLIQIGGSVNDIDPAQLNVNPIASTLFDTYIVKGSLNNTVTPAVVTVADLTDAYQSMLIEIDEAEFIAGDTSKTYAVTSPQTSANLNVKTCSGGTIIVRSSGFANFAGINAPNGNGKLLAIYTRFRSTKQLIIRDTSDVQFTGPRCGGSTGPGTPITVAQLRALYTGTDLKLDKNYTVTGVVIADIPNKNISTGNVVIQDGNTGIAVYLGGTLTYAMGDSVVFNLTTADSLIKFSGSLEVKTAFGTGAPAPVATGKTVTPKVKTIAEINTALGSPLGDPNNIEFTLVKIAEAAATPGGTYNGNKTLTDASGTIAMFTRSVATFSGATIPTGNQNWVGYASMFNSTKQFLIRNTADVTAGSGGGGGGLTGITLNTSPLTLAFDGIGATLPTGVSIRNLATATVLGTELAANTGVNFHWGSTSGGAKVFASATGLTETTDSATQSVTANRAIGYRQTGSNGDPGAAFVFQVDNTSGKTNLAMEFLLQSLDKTSTRTVTWAVDYGFGDAPTSFTQATTSGTMTTGGSTWTNNTISVNFGSALDNQTGKVWIRIIALTNSTGSSTRPSTGVDDVKFTWN
ncbi:hypothetical protein BH10BAC3_BH10BAC3_25960 [soil metagenome]